MKKATRIFAFLLIVMACESPTINTLLKPFTYSENFETNELSAWASYPLWQDTAYDPNMRVTKMVPGDSNLSIVEIVTPYTNVDNYAGAQKLLDMYMMKGSFIKLRYFLKTHLNPEYFKVRLAAGPDGTVDYTVTGPETNKWVSLQVRFDDIIKQNPGVPKSGIKVNALAVFAKFPSADPTMPILFGIDDVEFNGTRTISFDFIEPEVFELSEWKPRVPKKHYQQGETFTVKGTWPIGADKVSLSLTSFTDRDNKLLEKGLENNKDEWTTTFDLSFPEGLYLATLEATGGAEILAEAQFTIFLSPKDINGIHPRTIFDKNKRDWVIRRLNSARFNSVKEDIISKAKNYRESNPVKEILYNVDQFPGADINSTLGNALTGWSSQIGSWRVSIKENALAYSLLGDKEAGEYAKNLLVKICGFPQWVHPWWKGRGRHIYYPIGLLGMEVATGYDLLYDLLSPEEREQVRHGLTKHIVEACHKGYVEDNLVTNNTSNWVSHITSGSLMAQAAMYGDDETATLEPYFTGVVLKTYDFIQKAIGRDGAYGEGLSYYNFTMLSLSEGVPVMDNVFNIDMSDKINGSYKELVWAGNIQKNKSFYFGDSGGDIMPMVNWAWLLDKYQDPLLGWLYQKTKKDETLMDVLYETDNVPKKNPFDENPVRVFRDVGTTVFKSGWEEDDFIFVMRTGAFYNHQHLDQGTFWLSDLGSIFVSERHGSTYYNDAIYQSHYTQPVGHSTILIDHNEQSQRTGDPLVFADGFDDKASIYHFLDGSNASFSAGDIGKLYWGKVNKLRRNVLYLKPCTLLMIDIAEPSQHDVDVTLLYQAGYLKDIAADQAKSILTVKGKEMHISHVYPDSRVVESEETPHYLSTLLNERPLNKEGMLTVSASTQGKPLVIANILSSNQGDGHKVEYEEHEGYVSGLANSKNFVFSTSPGAVFSTELFKTDALAVTWDDESVFLSVAKSFEKDGKTLMISDVPVTCEILGKTIKYYHNENSNISFGVDSEPSSITLNGSTLGGWKYDQAKGLITVGLPKEEGTLIIN